MILFFQILFFEFNLCSPIVLPAWYPMFNVIPTIDLTNVVPYTLVISSTIMEDKIVAINEYRYKCIGIQQCAEATLLKCKF